MDRDAEEFLSFLATILALGVAVLCFLSVGVATLLGMPRVADDFDAWGLPSWARIALGLIEVVGVLALLVPTINFRVALILMAVTAFRLAMTLRQGEAPWLALVALAALGFIAYRFRPAWTERLLAEDPAQLS